MKFDIEIRNRNREIGEMVEMGKRSHGEMEKMWKNVKKCEKMEKCEKCEKMENVLKM